MIRIERPPNYDAIVQVFPKAATHGVLFAYGEDIFNPSNANIPKWIAAHEYKHCARQFLTTPESWWGLYLKDPEFRYYEEVLAHAAEYREALTFTPNDRNAMAKLLDRTARRLIAPLYEYTGKTLQLALKDVARVAGL